VAPDLLAGPKNFVEYGLLLCFDRHDILLERRRESGTCVRVDELAVEIH
jgi:hypothetical protein